MVLQVYVKGIILTLCKFYVNKNVVYILIDQYYNQWSTGYSGQISRVQTSHMVLDF